MCDDPPYTPVSCSKNRKGQSKKEDAPDLEFATPELSKAYRILQGIIRISKYFLEEPDHREKGMHDYYDVISKPIWFREIQQKFARGDYSNISEFVKDVRCLLLNCYIYFGPHDVHTKRALKVEQVLEQKIALLPADLRAQCSLESTHGIDAGTVKYAGEVQSQLLQSVIGERSRRECEQKQKLLEEHCKEKEGKEQDLLLWEQEKLFTGSDYEKMKNMWELPVIGHFVALSLEQLNIKSISMYELERIILMPQASKSLAVLMTSLLSTPFSRLKLHTKPPMPYKIWTRKLEFKVSGWYKIYIKCNKNPDTVFEKLGIEHQFWKIMGDWNPLKEYEFHELTFHQRVSLIKALCDFILQNHKTLRDAISERHDEFGKCLGEDRSGAKFLYFPQFLDQDVRIYRQAFEPKNWIERDLDHQTELLAENINKATECRKSGSTANRKYKRRVAWKRGKIIKQHRLSHPKHPKRPLKSLCKSPDTGVVSVTCKSDNADGISAPDSAVHGDDTCLNEGDSELLGNVNSSPCTKHSPERINEHLPGETHIEHSSNTSSVTNTGSETSELEISENQSLDPELKGTSHSNESRNMKLNSSQTVISENCYTSDIESQLKKCSGECAESALCSHLNSEEMCDVNSDKKVDPLILRIKNDSAVKESEWTVEKVPLYQTEHLDANKDNDIKKPKIRRPLHNAHWLEPDPDDFKLVADSVEGVRLLLTKYCDDDLVLIEQLNKKSRKRIQPSCEVRLARRLVSLMSDLDSVELKILTNTKGARERLYKEWEDFKNRSADYTDPDEAFWLNEKEPIDIPECYAPQIPAFQNSDTLEDTELPQTQVPDTGGTPEDPQLTAVSGMKLRQRVIIRDKYDELAASDESSEDDSDESDNWVMPNSRKNKSIKRKKINPVHLNSVKKQHTSEAPSPKLEESSLKIVANSMPDLEVLNVSKLTEKHSTMTAAALRVKKRLFLQNEASSSEANRQLEWEKNRQKLVNLAANKSSVQQSAEFTSTTVIVDNMNKIILDGNGKITVSATNNKALLTLQGRKLGDVIKEGKLVKKGGLITGVIGIEMEKAQSQISRVQNTQVRDGNIQTGKYSSRNCVSVSASPSPQSNNCREDCGSIVTAVSTSGMKEEKKKKKQSTGTPLSTLSSGQVLQGCTEPVIKKNSEVVCISDDSDNSDIEFVGTVYNPKLAYLCDKQKISNARLQHSTVSTQANSSSQQKCIAPKSVSLVEGETSIASTKPGTSPCNGTKRVCSTVNTQDNHASQQIHIAPKIDLQVTGETAISTAKPVTSACGRNRCDHSTIRTQGDTVLQQTHPEMSTASMKPRTSTFSSAATLPNHLQTLVVNSHTVTTQFAPNISQMQDKVEQQSQANNAEIEIHIASQKLDNLSETMQKPVIVQPGCDVSLLRNCLFPTEPINYVESPSLAPSRDETAVSPFSPSSTKSAQYNSVTTPGTVTHTQKFNSVSSTAANNIGINLESQLVSSYTSVSQSPFLINPYTATAGASPGTPVIQAKASGILSEQPRRPAGSFTQNISTVATVAKTYSPVPKPSSFSQFPSTSLTPTRIVAPPLDQVRSPSMSSEKVRYPSTPVNPGGHPSHVTPTSTHYLSPEVRTPNSSLVKTRNTSSALARFPDSSLANSRGSDISLDEARVPGTPTAKRRILGTPVMQTRSPSLQVAQTRIPGTPGAYARTSGTPKDKTRSPSTPVTQMRSPSSMHFTQTASPGASFVQTRRSVSPSFQSQLQGVHVSPAGGSASRGRGSRNTGTERGSSNIQQQMEQTAARLVVIPGDENVSKYAIVFPSGAKVILTPKQVADIRAANGGLLTTNM